MHRADWSTIVPGGVGKCHYPVSKARNTTWDHNNNNNNNNNNSNVLL